MRSIIAFICILLIAPTSLVVAQAPGLLFGQGNISITLEPPLPQPLSQFTASIDDYSLPAQSGSIRWTVDGKLLSEFNNKRTIELQSPAAGKTLRIVADLTLTSGETVSVTNTVTPNYLDIIIEPQTRTPAFYTGRAIPSLGSTVNATAILNGDTTGAGGYLYSWRLNNTALEGGVVRGKNTVSFIMPRGRSAILTLDVQRATGELVARRVLDIPSTSPRLLFYEQSTLYGQKEQAIGETLVVTGSTASVRAEPYYLDVKVFNDPDFFEWQIDRIKQPTPSMNPYEITLAPLFSDGRSSISFQVRDLEQLLQGANGNFVITN